MNIQQYNLEEAINVMRNSSKLGQTFHLRFRKIGGGDTIISKASLRNMAPTSKDSRGKYKLQIANEENGSLRSCYIPLIKEVNGIKVTI